MKPNESKRDRKDYFCLPFGSPSTHISLDESLEGNSSTPVSNFSVSSKPDSKEHVPHSASPDQSASCDTDTTAAGSPIPMSHPSWLDPLLHHPLYPIIVKAWAEFWFEGLVDQDGSTSNTQETTPSSSGTTTDGESGKRPSKGSKRQRESANQDDSRDAKRVKPSNSHNSISASESKSGLACHFYKLNPKQHHACTNWQCDEIRVVKQHLLQSHKLGPIHCRYCWISFADEEDVILHDCTPTGGKSVDDLKSQRVPSTLSRWDQWYWIWKILFPNFQKPKTPYYTDDAVIRQFLSFAASRYPVISSSNVPEELMEAWSSTSAYTLNTLQLLTPATTVSEDGIHVSPPPPQTSSENVDTSRNAQPPEIPMHGIDEGITSSMLPESENLLFSSQPPMESIDEILEEFYSSSAPEYGIDTTNGVENSADYDSGTGFVPILQEDMSIDMWDIQQAFIDDPSDGEPYQHRTFAEEMALQDFNRSAQNLQQGVTGYLSNVIFDEHWDYVEGMPADEHMRRVIPIDSIVDFQHHTWKEMNEEQPGNLDAEDSP
ncbi:hypothetical protein G7054_g10352 [Neopestalotiopsis clavispora]|nr:hypothetical protein G7054_g10352 [Neopestalotiopsis clavispora]